MQYWQQLFCSKENVDKEVIQLQYLKWPDHGVPDNVGSFLNFRRKARASMSPDTRTVVHCRWEAAEQVTVTFLNVLGGVIV